jgi:ribosome-associated protein
MDIRKLQRVIVDGLEDVKAQNIVVFNTEHLSPLFERVIVASGTSNRQTKSLAASVRDAVKAAGDPPPRTEGEDNGEWIIVDCGAAVVHVMQPAIRDYYHLEELWGDKPVKMKIASAAPRLVKAAANQNPTRGDGEKAAARGTIRRVVPAERPGSAATPAKRAPAKRAPAKRAAGTRAAPAKRVVIRTTGVKSTAAKATRTGPRPAAKKAAAKR